MKQKTIGLNPLEQYLNQKESVEESQDSAPVTSQAQGSSGKQRITLHISAAVIDRLKNAVYWEPGLTIAYFAEHALAQALDALEAERGEPFPQRREHRLRGGRPLI